MTLLNTSHRKNDLGEADRGRRRPFDASRLFIQHSDYDFGELTVPSIHLSKRFHFSADGYYFSECIIPLP